MEGLFRAWERYFGEWPDGGCSFWSVCVYGEIWWIWVDERVGEVFSRFDGEAFIFPAYGGNSRIGWIGFSGRETARLAE